ncbi:glucokinase [Melghirimyces profundicolus]|uniref:Glucokinase n=1 Tax=Melghirimyces profundicolus TaxID=1242148 RepID=A0A2T6BW65_9BACL|nr:ROK family protein [Melghirimyces profundicolus]PTX60303.1 glucokinase [Melghirimyces profundicolus]
MKPACIGVDLGGTKIAAARVEPNGYLTSRVRMETRAREGPERVLERISEAIRNVMAGGEVDGIGVASPGPLDARTGTILSPPNLPGWDRVPLKAELEQKFGVPVRVENDANAAAWGEYLWGAGMNSDPLVYITVSTGIGSGLVVNDRLLRGADTFAGELGQMVLEPSRAQGGHLRDGTLEGLASGTAIDALAAEAAGPGSRIWKLAEADGERPRAEHVFAALKEGDPDAEAIVEKVIHYLAVGVANAIHFLNPRRIVIGGGVAKAGDRLFTPLRERVEEWLMPSFVGTYDILPSALGDDAGILGAAALWEEGKKGSVSPAWTPDKDQN